jgi:hypothetical protein
VHGQANEPPIDHIELVNAVKRGRVKVLLIGIECHVQDGRRQLMSNPARGR